MQREVAAALKEGGEMWIFISGDLKIRNIVQREPGTFTENHFTLPHKFPTMFKFPKLLIIWPQILQTDKTTSKVFENAEKNYKKKPFLTIQNQ